MFDQRRQRSLHRAPQPLATTVAAVAETLLAASVVGSPSRCAQLGCNSSRGRHISGSAPIPTPLGAGIRSCDGQRVLQ